MLLHYSVVTLFIFFIYNILSFCHYKNKNVDISRVTAISGVKISDKTMTKTSNLVTK